MSQKFLSDVTLSTVTGGSMLKLDANGKIVAAVDGTDYISASATGYFTASSGSGIYYDGDVRIGTYQTTVAPDARLHIFDYQTVDPKLLIEDGNTGDASMEFKISAQSFTMGIDNSDSDKFVISATSGLGTSNVLEIATSGLSAFQNSVLVKGSLFINNQEQIQQGATEKIASFQNLGTERGYFEVTVTGKGYFYADGFKTGATTVGFLKSDGSVDTGSFFSGNYSDLSGKPTLGTMAAANTSDYKDSDAVETYVAGELVYTNISGTPTLGTAAAADVTDFAAASHTHSYLPLSGGTLYKQTNTTGTSGTAFLTVHNNVGGDISQQQSFIDFMFTDTNANFTPQVRIGAQVGRDADANAISKEGAGAFVVYTGDGTDESGGGSLTEAMRVSYSGKLTVGGDIYSGSAKIATESFASGEAEAVQDNLDGLSTSLGSAAYTDSTAYATAAQGALADSALQSLPSHNHDGRYYTETEADNKFAQNGNNLVPINATDSNYQLFTEEVILATASTYRGLAFPNGGRNFVFEVSIKGTNGANHQGIFWGLDTLATIYNNGEAGYKLTHQAEGAFHIRDIASNANQATSQDVMYAPNDGLYHRYKIISYVDPSNSNKAFFKVYVDGNLIFNAPQFAAPPQVPTYFGFINYTGEATFSNWNVREITGEAELALLYGDGVFQPAGNYLTSLPAHHHDARYYTETEMDTFLAGKLSTSGGVLSGALNVLYTDSPTGTGWDKNLFIGTSDDLGLAGAFPTYVPSGSYGFFSHANSDGVFIGSVPTAAGSSNYYATIAWGDDSTEYLQFLYKGTQVAYLETDGDFYIDGSFYSGTSKIATETFASGEAQAVQDNLDTVVGSLGSNAYTSYTDHTGLYDTVGSAAAEAGAVQDNLDSLAGSLGNAAFTSASDYATASHNHDDRYYTESESDTRFLNTSGDTATGLMTFSAGIDYEYAFYQGYAWYKRFYVRSVGLTGSAIANSWVLLGIVRNENTYERTDVKFRIRGYDDVSSGTEIIQLRVENHSTAQEIHQLYWYADDATPNLFREVKSVIAQADGLANTYFLWVKMAGDWTDTFTVEAEVFNSNSRPFEFDDVTVIPEGGAPEVPVSDITKTERVWYTSNASIHTNGGRLATESFVTGQGYLTSVPSSYATTSYVDTAVSNLVDSAPTTLDTLNELAAALGDDPNFATTVTNSIATKLPLSGGTLTGDLTIDNNTPRIDFKADQSGANVGGRIELNENGNLWVNAQGGKDLWLNWLSPTSPASKADLQVGDGNSGSAILTVQGSTRRVGINKTSPTQALDVSGNIVASGTLTASGYNKSNWDTAYGWGNHASAGYLTSVPSDYTIGNYRTIADYGGNTTWFIRGDGDFVFATGHDWTASFGLDLNSGVGYAENAGWAFLGQSRSNAGNGTWRGVKIVKFQEGTTVAGDLSAGAFYIGDNRKDDRWDTAYNWGNHASAGYLSASSYTAADVLAKIKTVDGAGSGLDADLLDGLSEATFMRRSANSNLAMNNYNITGVNHITINDSGFGEGIGWQNWLISDCPDDLSNQAGNLQISSTADPSIRVTVDPNGNLYPSRDRLHALGLETNRWQIVFCEILDSAGQHEKNLQNPEGEKSVGEYETGTVLVWKGGKNVPCTTAADHMRMGIAVKGIDSPLIQGAEPVLVTGAVNEGDYLVTSTKEGHAEAISPEFMRQHNLFDCVLGKALESAEGESHLVKTWINI